MSSFSSGENFLPPLHINLGLHVRIYFPNVRDAKIKEFVFVGHQMRELM
jgi:hypothetical protein